MARIKTYEKDLQITGQEKVIGTDTTGETLNYKIDDIRDYIASTAEGFEQDNIRVVITTYTATSLNYSVADMINNDQFFWGGEPEPGEPKLTILDKWIPIVRVPVELSTGNSESLYYHYYLLLNRGKGTYGLNGTTSVSSLDFLRLREVELEVITSDNILPPKVFNLVSQGSTIVPHTDVDNSSLTFNLNENRDYYFKIFRQPSSGLLQQNVTDYKLYRFLGDNGVYGSGGSSTVSDDYLLIEREEFSGANTGLRVINILVGATIDPVTIPGDNVLKAIQRSFRGVISISTDDLYIFEVQRKVGNSLFTEKYYWCGGRMEDITSNSSIDDFYLDFEKKIVSLTSEDTPVINLNDSITDTPEDTLNNSQEQFIITSDKPVVIITKNDIKSSEYKVYQFTGSEGIYGVGGDSVASDSDFDLIVELGNTDFATLEEIENLEDKILNGDNIYTGRITIENVIQLEPVEKPSLIDGTIFRETGDPDKIKVVLDGQYYTLDMTPDMA